MCRPVIAEDSDSAEEYDNDRAIGGGANHHQRQQQQRSRQPEHPGEAENGKMGSSYKIRMSGSFLTMVLSLSNLMAFLSGRFGGYYMTQSSLNGRSELTAVHGDPFQTEYSPLPAPLTGKPVPKTTYSAKHFDTGVTVTSSSQLVRKDPDSFLSELPNNNNASGSVLDSSNLHEPAGQHLLVDIENVEAAFLDSEDRLARAMIDLVRDSDLTMLSYHCHRLIPMGVSCVGVLLESHVSFHTWPTEGVITLDLFTCGPSPLVPILPSFERMFGIPRHQTDGGPPPRMVWSHKKRGFRRDMQPFPADAAKDVRGSAWLKSRVAEAHVEDSGIQQTPVIRPQKGRSPTAIRDLEASAETLVHPAMLAHENPKTVAILGDSLHSVSALAQQVLKHETVARLTIVADDGFSLAESPIDDPRVQMFPGCTKGWLATHYLEESQPDGPYDFVIVGSIDLKQVRAAECLYNALATDGIIAMSTGNLPKFNDAQNLDDEKKVLIETFAGLGIENAIEYGDAHGARLLILKDVDTRAGWFQNEAELLLKIWRRVKSANSGEFPFRYIDSATLSSLQYPSRVQEDAFCQQSPRPESCIQHGYDPDIPNTSEDEVVVKISGAGDSAGRGVYAKRRIEKGSYLAIDKCSSGMYISPSTWDLILDCAEEKFKSSGYWQALFGYIDGYGWVDNHMGVPSAGVDPGILTFVNHGCNGTFNMGTRSDFTELTAQLGVGPEANGYSEGPEVYDPFYDRHFPQWFCGESRALRDIQPGEELLDNYFVFGGVGEGEDWEENLEELKRMCSGEGIGLVKQYEESKMAADTLSSSVQ